MKRVLLTALLLVNTFFVYPQSTWLQKLFWNVGGNMGAQWDTIMGLRDAALSPDGSLYTLVKCAPNDWTSIIKLSPGSHNYLWSVSVGDWGSVQRFQANFIRATSDSGCIVAQNHANWTFPPFTEASVKKYTKTGTLLWSYTLSDYPQTGGQYWVYDIIENAAGNYYALSIDTLYEIDNSGILVNTYTSIHGTKFHQLPNGDFLVRTNGTVNNPDSIVRTTFPGNILWTVATQHGDLVSFTSSAAFICHRDSALSISTVKKVDALNGNILWQDTIPFANVTNIEATSEGGFIASAGADLETVPAPPALSGYLFKADASGNQLWLQSYNFPVYGLSTVKEIYPGYYLTGATWNPYSLDSPFASASAFIATVDSAGNSVLQTTTNLWGGDANTNDTLDIGDYLYMAIASGSSGYARSDSFFLPMAYWWNSDFCPDWSQSFSNGINYKHADLQGDGVVDASDLNTAMQVWYFWVSYPVTWRSSNFQAQTVPDFILLPEKDTVAPGENIRIYIIAGNSITPVDSVYGIAFTGDYNVSLTDSSFNLNYYNSDFGTPGVNLFAGSHNYPGQMIAVISKTDYQNKYLLYDTLGVIELKANTNITSFQTLNYQITNLYAITLSTSEVLFNAISGSVVIDPSLVSVEEYNFPNETTIFPNPVSDELMIYGLESSVSLKVYDVLGNEILSKPVTTGIHKLKTGSWQNGIYFLKISSENKTDNFRFAVQH